METSKWVYGNKPDIGVEVLVLLEDGTTSRCSVDDKGIWDSWVTIVAWQPIEGDV